MSRLLDDTDYRIFLNALQVCKWTFSDKVLWRPKEKSQTLVPDLSSWATLCKLLSDAGDKRLYCCLVVLGVMMIKPFWI